MIIVIGGRAGSGKSTVARLLSERLRLKYYSMGDLTRKIAKEKNISLTEINKLEETDPAIDKQIDNLQKELGEKEDDFVIDSRLGILFIPNANFKVFLDADEDIRAERIFRESRLDELSNEPKDTIAKIRSREESEIRRYTQYYDFNCYDKNKYDIVINTTNLKPEEVVKIIVEKVKNKLS